MFLGLQPDLAVITNVEHDHPDLFPTPESFEKAFQMFVDRLKPQGTLILCGEDRGAKKLAAHQKSGQKLIYYGFESDGKDYVARNIRFLPAGGCEFELIIDGDQIMEILLQLPGEHNVLNAIAAFAAADQLNLDRDKIVRAIKEFKGSERRFDIRGEYLGITLIDDYAHHPTEIKTTLAAARSVFPDQRLVCVWQPHTFSRTQTLFSDFTKAFDDADHVIVLDVYAAREQKPKNFSLSDLVERINGNHAVHLPGKNQVVEYLKNELIRNDVLLIFTAGDAIEINESLEKYYSSQVEH
jgi:UDP-N-acetylmuramate--alanine ligase